MHRSPTLWTLLLSLSLLLGGVGFATAQDKAAAETKAETKAEPDAKTPPADAEKDADAKPAAKADAVEEADASSKDVKPPSTPLPTPEPTPEAVAKADCASFCGEWCGMLDDIKCTDKSLKDDFDEGRGSCKKSCPKVCEEGAMPAYLTTCGKTGDCKKLAACVAEHSGEEEE